MRRAAWWCCGARQLRRRIRDSRGRSLGDATSYDAGGWACEVRVGDGRWSRAGLGWDCARSFTEAWSGLALRLPQRSWHQFENPWMQTASFISIPSGLSLVIAALHSASRHQQATKKPPCCTPCLSTARLQPIKGHRTEVSPIVCMLSSRQPVTLCCSVPVTALHRDLDRSAASSMDTSNFELRILHFSSRVCFPLKIRTDIEVVKLCIRRGCIIRGLTLHTRCLCSV